MRWLALVSLLLATAAQADDHMIRPTCWEENVNGVVHRNCAVNRPPSPQAGRPEGRVAASPPAPTSGPPPEPAIGPPAGPNPCHPYAPGYCPAPPGALRWYPNAGAWSAPPPYYYPGPLVVFRVGPFTVVVP